MHIVQTVILKKQHFTKPKAIEWIALHGYNHSKIDETPNEYRFRQVSPEILKTNMFRERMIKIGDKGYLGILYND